MMHLLFDKMGLLFFDGAILDGIGENLIRLSESD